VSRSFVAPGAADGSADAPDISADGRYIAYRSYATNTPAGNPSGLPLVLVYDRFSDSTSILSAGSTSGLAANSRSLAPLFSGDGRMIFFRSFASDLSGQDFNGNGDVFGYAFLYLSITASPTPGGGPILSWPVAPGETYLVQYKNHLTDSSWLPVSGTISIQGNRGSLTDLAPATGQRFYRVIANQP
jgi:hypothetical protein